MKKPRQNYYLCNDSTTNNNLIKNIIFPENPEKINGIWNKVK